MFLQHGTRVAGGDEAAADQHAMAVPHAQLIVGIRNTLNYYSTDHDGDFLQLVGRHHAITP